MKGNYVRMKKAICLWILFLSVYILSVIVPVKEIFAQEETQGQDVLIENLTYDKEYKAQFETKVRVRFLNKDYYNENLYLSYHVYAGDGETLLSYENQRISIQIEDNCEALMTVPIDLSTILKQSKEEQLIVRFDIVDQENVYWFLDNANINFETCSVYCTIDKGAAALRVLKSGVREHPIILTVNLAFCLLSIAGLIYMRKSKE